MVRHPGLVSTSEQVLAMAERLKQAPVIAFDTEFIRETTFFPVVELIQVATEEESWLVDAAAFSGRRGHDGRFQSSAFEGLRPLLDIFQDRSILKLAHAVQGDQECIYTSFGVVAVPCLDTAIAASLCGYGDGIGLGNLLKSLLDVDLGKGHARSNWSARPLPEQLAEYAHADVVYLVSAWKKLEKRLEQVGRRDWAFEQSAKWENPAVYDVDPKTIAEKLARGGRLDKRAYAALVELVQWREQRVRYVNLPRRWVADDNVLLDIAKVRPKDIDHLSTFRGLNKGELKNSGEAILAALKRASEVRELVVPKSPKVESPTSSEGQVLDLLRCYVGMLADNNRIAVKHLLTAAQMLPLLRSDAKTSEALVAQGLMSEGAAKLVGDEVLAFLDGRRDLSVDGNRVNVVKLESRSSL